MSNGVTEMANLIPEIWSPKMYEQLRSKNSVFMNIFEREYEGEIKGMGDIVRVNTVNAPNGEILTDDKASFSSEALSITQNTVTVNKRASASFEITDLAELQSMSYQAAIQEALVYAIRAKIEDTIISTLSPSASAPDHIIAPTSASDLAAVDFAAMRTLLSQAKVPTMDRWFVCDPAYYGDALSKTALSSVDFVSGRNAEEGQIARYMGFNIVEHDRLSADLGYAVHPSAVQLVMQQGLRIKISDLHAQNKYGYLISADIVFGLAQFDDTRLVKITG